jgi:putative DNA primase/helicase
MDIVKTNRGASTHCCATGRNVAPNAMVRCADASSSADPLKAFRDAILAAGLVPPEFIEPDGRIHRFSASGCRGDDAGWYVFRVDAVAAGAYGDWRTGIQGKWCSAGWRSLTAAECDALRAKAVVARTEWQSELARQRERARHLAADLWARAEPAAPSHEYLRAKGIRPHGLRESCGRLLVPVRDADGHLHSIQSIGPEGDKRFLRGGRVDSCYFGLGRLRDVICVAEGIATGISIHEVSTCAVAVAFSAGNLVQVATALRHKYPTVTIVICADDDFRTAGNPGVTKAMEAARTVAGLVAVPDFGVDRPERASDFNDMLALRGAAAVRECLRRARAVEVAHGAH